MLSIGRKSNGKKEIDALKRLLGRADLDSEQRQALTHVLEAQAGETETSKETRRRSLKTAPMASHPRLQLNLGAFGRRGPKSEVIRVCLDFGTAMSKAWATGRGAAETLPLLIGKAAGSEGLTVPSSIFIGDNGRIYLGTEAERQHRANIRSGRPQFDNLKRMLSEALVNTDLNAFPLREGIDPTASGLSSGDLLVLYFAWLTDMTEIALQEAITATKGALSLGKSDTRAVARRFAIPCFESADGRAAWAKSLMIDALLRAQILADTLHGNWDKVTTAGLVEILPELYQIDLRRLAPLILEDCEIREPVAAGASRFETLLGDRTVPAPFPNRQYLLIIDAGAGTTDFAMFQSITKTGELHPSFALLRRSVRMSRIAGNEIDAILRPLVLKACGVDSNKFTEDDCAYARMDLESQIREIKRNLFDKKKTAVELRPHFSGTVGLRDLLSDKKMTDDGEELRGIRDEIVAAMLSREQLEEIRSSNRGAPIVVHVLLTGGSSTLPIIDTLSEGRIEFEGARFKFQKIVSLPAWINELPRESAQQLADVYPQCAVAIGGSVPKLPVELTDFDHPITPGKAGRRTLPRTQMTGI